MSKKGQGLRARLDEEMERRRAQSRDLQAIREHLKAITEQTSRLRADVKAVAEKDLAGKTKKAERTLSDLAETSRRVAATFQERHRDLQTIRQAGEEASRTARRMRGLAWRVRLEGALMGAGAVLIAALALALILWTSKALTPLSLPMQARMTDSEQEQVELGQYVQRSLSGLSAEEETTLKELLRKGHSSPVMEESSR
jgi:hypothetical protein